MEIKIHTRNAKPDEYKIVGTIMKQVQQMHIGWRPDNIIPLARKIIEKGYQLYIQPMLTFRYSDSELLELIDLVNRELPDASAFYIVDRDKAAKLEEIAHVLGIQRVRNRSEITLKELFLVPANCEAICRNC